MIACNVPTAMKLCWDLLSISKTANIVSFTQGSITHQCDTWKPRQRKEGSRWSWLLVWAHQCAHYWSQSGVTAGSFHAKPFVLLSTQCDWQFLWLPAVPKWLQDQPIFSDESLMHHPTVKEENVRKIMASSLAKHEWPDVHKEFLCVHVTLLQFTRTVDLNKQRNSSHSMKTNGS